LKPEVNIQALLERIKNEGIAEARKEAEAIVAQARAEADAIRAQARAQASELLQEAENDVERSRAGFEAAMSQAARDLILAVKDSIKRLCDDVLTQKLATALTPEMLREMLLKILTAWKPQQPPQRTEVLLSPEDWQQLEEALCKSLQEAFTDGVVLKPMEGIEKGFRIGIEGEHVHYDLTGRGIAELLSEYLSPRVARFLKDGNGSGGKPRQ
jgi:V/A-type H+-transporting ATPase subunit E